MPLAPGSKLGPYEIGAPLGAGGMGEVYRAKDTRLERTVAIKILPAQFSSDPVRKQRFEREAKTISSLNHPHICTLHDVGSQDGVDYLVMECVEGQTLAKSLEKGALPLEQVLKYGAQIADALDKAHRHGMVHRDLKPGNIMLTASGAKLLDFGLAKLSAPMASVATMTATAVKQSPATEQGTIVGTFQYMSPEQIEGKEVDGRSDIFSLGAVLYEMLTGKRAFEGKSQLSVASAILEREPAPISAVKPSSPVALDRTIRKCLAKERDARWQSVGDLATQLGWIAEAQTQNGIAAPSIAARNRLAGLGWLVSVGLLILLGAGGALWLAESRQAQRTMYFSSPFAGVANYLALSKDGQTVAMVSYSEQKNKYMIWTYKLGERNASIVEGTDDASNPFWSPDGNWIGFFSQGKLKKVDASGTSVQVLADAPNGRGGSWNKDGVILFTPDVFTGVYRIASNGGTPTEVTTLDAERADSSHRWPTFLPDGKHFLYLAANFSGSFEKNAIFLGSLDSKEKRLVLAASSNVVYAEPGYLVYLRDSDRSLVSQRFDLNSFSTSGDSRVVQSGVRYLPQVDLALFDVAGKRTLVAQTGKGAVTSQLEWFDRTGKVVGTVGGPGSFANPSLSNDGQKLAFDEPNPNGRMFGIWTRDLRTGAVSRLTLDDSLNQVPIWSPDGKKVVFTSNRNRFNRLYWKNGNGSGAEEQIVDLGAIQEVCWDWSRDGKFLLVRKDRELWAISLKEMKAMPYLQGKGAIRNGQFSPDGKWVAYASNESGMWEVYVSPFPEANSKWQVSRGGGEEPRWRSDGKELFYLSSARKLMTVEVKLSSSLEARDPVELFQTRSRQRISSQDVFTYSVGEDGQRFLVNTIIDEPNAAPLSIALNWAEEMKEK
jgi:serine/threonine protein kinase/Tol biopolymer transport system component